MPELKRSVNVTTINESTAGLPPIHFPKGVKRISELEGMKRKSSQQQLSPMKSNQLMKAPIPKNQLQITDGSHTLKVKRRPSIPKMPSLMSALAREHLATMTLVSPAKTGPLLQKYDYTSAFIPTGPLPNRERMLQMKGPLAFGGAGSTLAIMEEHEARLMKRSQVIEEPPPTTVDIVEGEGKVKATENIEGSVDVEELKTSDGKTPTPIDFIKLVQSDPDFANRFCYCYRNEDYYDF